MCDMIHFRRKHTAAIVYCDFKQEGPEIWWHQIK